MSPPAGIGAERSVTWRFVAPLPRSTPPERSTAAAKTSDRLDRTARRVARGHGERLGAAERERVRPGRLGAERGLGLASAVCERYGYEPVRTGPESVRLRNCPFHPLAARAPELVCAINREFLSGMLTGLGARAVNARLEARPGECCVELHRA